MESAMAIITAGKGSQFSSGEAAEHDVREAGPVLEFNLGLNTKPCLDQIRGTPTEIVETNEPPDYPSPVISPNTGESPPDQQVRTTQQIEEYSAVDCGHNRLRPTVNVTRTFALIANTIDPLFILLVHLFNALQNIENALRSIELSLVHTTNALVVIGIQSALDHQPHWLFILLDNSECCGRKWQWFTVYHSTPLVDNAWRTLSSARGIFGPGNFIFPELDTNHLQALVTPASVPSSYPIASTGQICRPFWSCPPSGTSKKGTSQAWRVEKTGQNRGKTGARSSGGGGGAPGPSSRKKAAAPKNPKSGGRLFACHYYKRWPFKHLACLHHCQMAPRYVKTHLLRTHRQPMHCPMCFATFATRALYNTHVIGRTCERSEESCPFSEGISDDQELALVGLPGGDGPEKWYAQWRVLFPGIDPPASPYVDTEDMEGNVVTTVRDARGPCFTEGLAELQQRGSLSDVQVQMVQALHDTTYGPRPPPSVGVDGSAHQPPQLQQQTQHNHDAVGGSNLHMLSLSPSTTLQPQSQSLDDIFQQPQQHQPQHQQQQQQQVHFFGVLPPENLHHQGTAIGRTNRQAAIRANAHLHHNIRPPDQARHRRLVTAMQNNRAAAQGIAATTGASQQRFLPQGGIPNRHPPTMPFEPFPVVNAQLQPNPRAMARQQQVFNAAADYHVHAAPHDMFFQNMNTAPNGLNPDTGTASRRGVHFPPGPHNGFGAPPHAPGPSLHNHRRPSAASPVPGGIPGAIMMIDPMLDQMAESATQSTENASTVAGSAAAGGHEPSRNDPSDLSDVDSEYFTVNGG